MYRMENTTSISWSVYIAGPSLYIAYMYCTISIGNSCDVSHSNCVNVRFSIAVKIVNASPEQSWFPLKKHIVSFDPNVPFNSMWR